MRQVFRWWLAVGLALAFLSGCQCGDDVDPSDVPETVGANSSFVESHTRGLIGRDETIRVVLAPELARELAGESGEPPALDGVLVFKPDLAGTAIWSSDNEITFEPEEPLPNGQLVHVEVRLAKLSDTLKDADFSFNLEVRPQTFRFVQRALTPTKGGTMKLKGSIETGDPAEDSAVETMVSATFEGKGQSLKWTHGSPTRHSFEIEGLKRGDEARKLTLLIDGSPIGVAEVDERIVRVPAKGIFDVTEVVPVAEGSPRIEVRFSDLLDDKQDLRGLVTVEGLKNPRTVIEGESLGVYVGDRPTGTFRLTVQGVKNSEGEALAQPFTRQVTFGPQNPAVRYAGRGVVLPRSADLTVPIEARNLNGIWIEAIAVPGNNLPQFLQVNDLDGSNQMQRVGRRVWGKRIDIPQDRGDANRWRRIGLDLADFVQANPAGLYQLSIRFLPQDAVYDCPSDLEPIKLPIDNDFTDDESSYWDPYDGFGWDYSYWENREDPCHIGFYIRGEGRNAITRNVVVSDLGVTVKSGADDEVFVAVTDLVSARPVSEAMVTLLDYQTQPIGQATTNDQGIVRLNASRKPLLAVAEKGDDRTLVRMNSGSALSTAHFDAGGVALQKGLRGMIYGERGVWRPGDDIHLTLLRFDRTGQLPSAHPVEFTLLDPYGKLIDKQVVTGGPDGFTRFDTRTSPDGMTGPYVVTAKVGGTSFRETVRVETIKPNRLKINLDFGTELIQGPRAGLDADLEARWLFGAPAPDLRTNIEVRFSNRRTTFPKYGEYTFSDPSRRVDTNVESVFDGRLDGEGKTKITSGLDLPEDAPGMLNATFLTRVFEPSGNASIDEVSIPVSPHDRYVGIKVPRGDAARGMLLTDQQHKVELVLVDAKGNPVGGTHDLDVEVYKIRWRWWWETDNGNLGDYARRRSHQSVFDDSIKVSNGKGSFQFQVKYPEWGRYLVVARDKSGTHRASKPFYIDWPGWAGRARKDGPGGATVLSISTPNSKVSVGDEVTINIPAAASGRALVALETSTHVVDAEWIELTGEDQQYTFKATESMVPNVYANVTLVQPHQGTASDLPIRMYGITPIEVTSPKTVLTPVIKTKDSFRPESTADVTISEKDGRPMSYTLAVVDEGLLGITRFQTPDPHAAFHKREALGVRTWDIFGDVAGAYGGALEGVIAIGGDGEGDNPPSQKARRFPPVVQVMGPFTLEKGAKQTHRISVPEYIGELRVMVVAAKDGRFGRADQAVPVKAPVMVASTLPRVLGPQETIDLPVNVWLMDEKRKEVDLSVKVEGPLEIDGPSTQKLRFGAPGESLVQFALKSKSVGLARVVVTAKSGKEQAVQTTEIDVRPSTLRETRTVGEVTPVGPGQEVTLAVTAFGVEGTRTSTLEVSNLPPIDLDRRLKYLIRYPHGCAEQTTSKAFPQVVLKNITELSPTQRRDIDKYVRAAIDKLKNYQTSNGGFSLWPSGRYDAWVSNWAGHFLIVADRAGYRVPDSLLLSWMDHQTNQARRWQPQASKKDDWRAANSVAQAYRLYTLALAGDPEMGAMNRLKAQRDLPDPAKWRLAAAYAVAGQQDTAKQLIKGLPVQADGPTETGGVYNSPTREEAMILETLAILEPRSERTTKLMNSLSEKLASSRYLNTQAVGFSLIAIARLSEALGSTSPIKADVSVDGGKTQKLSSDKPLSQLNLTLAEKGNTDVVVKNRGEGALFVRAVTSALIEPGKEVSTTNGLRVSVVYKNADGRIVDVAKADHGMDFRAHVTLQNDSRRRLNNVALSAIFPSGWELHGQRSGRGPGYSYKEVRDDRVNFYVNLRSGEKKDFVVNLNAAYRGRFYLPQFQAEAMYDPTVNATTRGRWVEVSPLGPTASLK
ncbi:MAG: MG2 domain-containing protein [Myxococcota bacterium]